jgi:hypothetical protein
MQKIQNNDLGITMIIELMDSKKTYKIIEPKISFFGLFSNVYNPKTRTIVISKNATLYVYITGNIKKKVYIDNILFHELGHAYLHEKENDKYLDEMYVIENFENKYGGYTRINHEGSLW